MNHRQISHIHIRCRPVPVLDVRSCAQGRVWEDSEVTVAWGSACSHPGVIWYHQYRVKPSSIFWSIPIINCLPHQEPGREGGDWHGYEVRHLDSVVGPSRLAALKMHPDILSKVKGGSEDRKCASADLFMFQQWYQKDFLNDYGSRVQVSPPRVIRDISTFLLEQISPTKR